MAKPTLQNALNGANSLTLKPPTIAKVVKRIAAQVEGDLSMEDLREVVSALDRAAWEADGAGVTGVLLGLMIGLETGSGKKAPVAKKCASYKCEELVNPDWDYCSVKCRRRDVDRRGHASRKQRMLQNAATD